MMIQLAPGSEEESCCETAKKRGMPSRTIATFHVRAGGVLYLSCLSFKTRHTRCARDAAPSMSFDSYFKLVTKASCP
jgi:hypothetical protein